MEVSGDQETAVELFLAQHSMVHSAKLSDDSLFSFEDDLLNNLSPESFKRIPPNSNHSIAWIVWHLARVEDVTMNLLVADSTQVLLGTAWLDRLEIHVTHTGNGMSNEEVGAVSSLLDVPALRQYRLAVGRATRRIVNRLRAEDFKRRIDPESLRRIWDEKAMLPAGRGIVDYWAKKSVAGLLLMPPTRHCFLHLNEIRRIKQTLTG